MKKEKYNLQKNTVFISGLALTECKKIYIYSKRRKIVESLDFQI